MDAGNRLWDAVSNPIEAVWQMECCGTLRLIAPEGKWRQASTFHELACCLDELTGLSGAPPTSIDYQDWQHPFMAKDWPRLTPLPNGFTFIRWKDRLREMAKQHREWVLDEPKRDPLLKSLVEQMAAMPDNERRECSINMIYPGYIDAGDGRNEPEEGVIVYTCSMLGSWKPQGSWTDKRPRVKYKGKWRDDKGQILNWPPVGWKAA